MAEHVFGSAEPRSNTMKMGIHKDEIAPALARADLCFLLQPENIPWNVVEIANDCVQPAKYAEMRTT